MPREPLAIHDDARPTLATDGSIWLVALLLLGGSYGFSMTTQPPARTVDALDGAVAVTLPSGWAHHEEGGTVTAEHPSMDGMPPTLSVRRLDEELDPMGRDLAIARMEEERADHGVGFRVLHVDERTDAFGGNEATLVWWAMSQDPPGSRPGDAVIPLVVEGVDALVLTPGGEAFHVEAFEATHGIDVEDELQDVLRQLRIVGGAQ